MGRHLSPSLPGDESVPSWCFVCACAVSLELLTIFAVTGTPRVEHMYPLVILNITCDFFQEDTERCRQEAIFVTLRLPLFP